jgi:hypothetical protein
VSGPGPGYPTRPGYVPEEYLGQIRTGPDAPWEDYARSTEAEARRWQAADPDHRRVVDWIYKERVIFPDAHAEHAARIGASYGRDAAAVQDEGAVEAMARVIYEASDAYADEGVAWEDQHGSPRREAIRQAHAVMDRPA